MKLQMQLAFDSTAPFLGSNSADKHMQNFGIVYSIKR